MPEPDAEQRAEALRLARTAMTEGIEVTNVSAQAYVRMCCALLAAEAEVVELRERLDEQTIKRSFYESRSITLFERAERAEAREKRLEEALREIDRATAGSAADLARQMKLIARAVLSELTERE